MNNYKEKREQWKRENEKGEGGGRLVSVQGARFDDHSDTARRIEERRRESEQKNNPSSSMNR